MRWIILAVLVVILVVILRYKNRFREFWEVCDEALAYKDLVEDDELKPIEQPQPEGRPS